MVTLELIKTTADFIIALDDAAKISIQKSKAVDKKQYEKAVKYRDLEKIKRKEIMKLILKLKKVRLKLK